MVFFVAPVSIPQAGPSFEVISIKASRLGDQVVHARCRGTDGEMMLGSATTFVPGGYIAPGLGRCVLQGVTVRMIVGASFALHVNKPIELDRGVSGGPGWADSERFDIETKSEDPAHTTNDQLLLMLQRMLVDRFNLKFHHESKAGNGYALSLAGAVSKLKEASLSEPTRLIGGNPAGGLSSFQAASISQFTDFLSARLDADVEDKTLLAGKYNFTLHWQPGVEDIMWSRLRTETTSTDPTAPSLFTALQDQLGLKLKRATVQIDTIVIDFVERPSPQR